MLRSRKGERERSARERERERSARAREREGGAHTQACIHAYAQRAPTNARPLPPHPHTRAHTRSSTTNTLEGGRAGMKREAGQGRDEEGGRAGMKREGGRAGMKREAGQG